MRVIFSAKLIKGGLIVLPFPPRPRRLVCSCSEMSHPNQQPLQPPSQDGPQYQSTQYPPNTYPDQQSEGPPVLWLILFRLADPLPLLSAER